MKQIKEDGPYWRNWTTNATAEWTLRTKANKKYVVTAELNVLMPGSSSVNQTPGTFQIKIDDKEIESVVSYQTESFEENPVGLVALAPGVHKLVFQPKSGLWRNTGLRSIKLAPKADAEEATRSELIAPLIGVAILLCLLVGMGVWGWRMLAPPKTMH